MVIHTNVGNFFYKKKIVSAEVTVFVDNQSQIIIDLKYLKCEAAQIIIYLPANNTYLIMQIQDCLEWQIVTAAFDSKPITIIYTLILFFCVHKTNICIY